MCASPVQRLGPHGCARRRPRLPDGACTEWPPPHAGLSQDTPLAKLYAQVRTLRLADGPDAVHLASIGKLELKESAAADQGPDPMALSSVGVARSRL